MKRIFSAIILIPASLLVVIYATPLFYLIGIGLLGTVCLYEYFGLMQAMDIRVRPWFGYGIFWILLITLYHDSLLFSPILAVILVAAFISASWRRSLTVRSRTSAVMAEFFGILYMTLCLYPALPIRFDFSHGLHWTLLALLVIWGGDTLALIVGKKFGKNPFAPVLSPNKTNEGALAGLLAGIGIAVALQLFLFNELPLGHVIAVSILLGIFGQLGDLAESMIKRAAGIKDSSHLIPGHGGVLDRMDSLLFSFPVLYGYLLLIYG
jgi:phosphatidate cytidylyltransferase